MGKLIELRPALHNTRPRTIPGYDPLGRRLPCSTASLPGWAFILILGFAAGFGVAVEVMP